MTKSIEPNIADLANGWLKQYKLDYKLEQEPLNNEIDKALAEYHSKSGGAGANRPDAKLLLRSVKSGQGFPILIEYKGYQDKLVKLDRDGNVENRNTKNQPIFKTSKIMRLMVRCIMPMRYCTIPPTPTLSPLVSPDIKIPIRIKSVTKSVSIMLPKVI
ncbi:MAG: VRR-NUC domain-containing protein [Neisseria sp.]|nr:VRR-NUC domain-containing protein [Neisseria sp.]